MEKSPQGSSSIMSRLQTNCMRSDLFKNCLKPGFGQVCRPQKVRGPCLTLFSWRLHLQQVLSNGIWALSISLDADICPIHYLVYCKSFNRCRISNRSRGPSHLHKQKSGLQYKPGPKYKTGVQIMSFVHLQTGSVHFLASEIRRTESMVT